MNNRLNKLAKELTEKDILIGIDNEMKIQKALKDKLLKQQGLTVKLSELYDAAITYGFNADKRVGNVIANCPEKWVLPYLLCDCLCAFTKKADVNPDFIVTCTIAAMCECLISRKGLATMDETENMLIKAAHKCGLLVDVEERE